jgi:hypothetical protein
VAEDSLVDMFVVAGQLARHHLAPGVVPRVFREGFALGARDEVTDAQVVCVGQCVACRQLARLDQLFEPLAEQLGLARLKAAGVLLTRGAGV